MPYIKQEDRSRFSHDILDAEGAIYCCDDPIAHNVDRFACFLQNMICSYLSNFTDRLFLNVLIPQNDRKRIENVTWSLIRSINRNSISAVDNAGELNYVISTVLWDISGCFPTIKPANYGFRCMLTGTIQSVAQQLQPKHCPNTEVYFMLQGLLSDVSTECYRRNTVPYEDSKIKENGDICT